MRWAYSVAAVASAFVIALVLLNQGASATLSRSEGDFWEYSIATEFADVTVSGSIVYSYDGQSVISVGGTVHHVDVMRLSGNFSYVDDEVILVQVTGLISGYAYEVTGDSGLVMETVTMIATQYSGAPPSQFETLMTLHETSTYMPPEYAGLASDEIDTGDSWTITSSVSVVTNWTEGAETLDTLEESSITFEYTVESVGEEVATPAGTFSVVEIAVTYPGGREVLWFSSDVGHYVQIQRFNGTEADPFEQMVLRSYSYDGGEDRVVVIIAILLVVATAVILLMLVLAIHRAGQHPGSSDAEGPEALDPDARFSSREDEDDGRPATPQGGRGDA
ncbi:MAG: hypothetical protein MUO94_00500 [Thermoplasmata archaeon]|nr:hypothetical protein [Thermoplasmata archaeon]